VVCPRKTKNAKRRGEEAILNSSAKKDEEVRAEIENLGERRKESFRAEVCAIEESCERRKRSYFTVKGKSEGM